MNVRTLCLGILSFGDASGYEIRKMAQEGRFSHFIAASYGAIYPALVKLEAEGLVTAHEERDAGKPPRRVHAITAAGREAFARALTEMPGEDMLKSEFLLVTMCAELVDPEHARHVINERLALYEAKIAHMEEAERTCEHRGSAFVIGFGLTMYRAMHAYLAAHRGDVEAVAGTAVSLPQAAE
jgi:DNA-binding PadR family transcriptional regulator